MTLKIHNSQSKTKEPFIPLEPEKVRMYVCGPTVYDEPHIGHLRSAYVFEVMRNYFEYSGYGVTFVRNVTDVDDKIIEKAKKSGQDDLAIGAREVTEKYFEAYKADLRALGIREPDREPKATAHIPEMVALIEFLIQSGHAYASGGDVYYGVASFEGYGKLSHQNKEMMLQNVRIEKNEKKRDALDFALWKAAKPGEPSWPSPWGAGRPGWHIECSAMSRKYLGDTFDIHGGGRDLIFPHHENEIAQSEAATGAPFARYWLHHGLVTTGGQKMAKSLKNFVTLRDIAAKNENGAEELKFLFLGTHYGAALDFTEDRMKMEKAVRQNFYFFFDELKKIGPTEASGLLGGDTLSFKADFRKAMDDDFNTPQALTILHEKMHAARRSNDPAQMLALGAAIKEVCGKVFGLFGDAGAAAGSPEIEEAIQRRAQAKKMKDFKKADEIRQEVLAKFNVEIIDSKDGTMTWRKR